MERYAGRLQASGGKLILAGVGDHVMTQLVKTETFEIIPEEDVFLATGRLGQSIQDALTAAEQWLVEKAP